MSADTSFFFPFFQQEMEKKKNNENETEKEGNGTTFLVTSFPGLLFYSDRKCYIIKRRENNTFILVVIIDQ